MSRSRSICVISGCGKPVRSHGFCSGHHYRWKQHGDPLGGRRFHKLPPKGNYALAQKFMNKARSWEGDDCLIWPHSLVNGYGHGYWKGKHVLIHKLLCEEVNGPAPADKPQAQHSCGVKACVNPAHLKWGDQSDNEQDKIAHGTYITGCRTREYHDSLGRNALGQFVKLKSI